MKKVLIASYYFPPHSHPGVQRPLKFAKYLPAFGYQPIVFTCTKVPWSDFDYETYETEVKGRMIVRSVSAPNFETIGKHVSLKTLRAKTILKLQSLLFEDRLDWTFGGRAEFVARATDEHVSLVFTTGPPHSAHFIGSYLKKQIGIPWVADFRDPMAKQPPANDISLLSSIVGEFKKKTLISLFENVIITQCDALITVTDSISNDLKNRYPKHANKIFTITNGFDEKDFNGIEPHVSDSVGLKLVHTGRFWHHQTPDVFFAGLERALDQVPSLNKELMVTFVGPHDSHIHERMSSGKLRGVISVRGQVSHREAIEYQLGSDANLLILSYSDKKGRSPIYSGKIFEYLRAGRPILAVVPKGPARKLIEEINPDYLADPGNPEEIARAIIRLHGDWEAGAIEAVKPSEEIVGRFNRKNLTETLAGIFDRLLL